MRIKVTSFRKAPKMQSGPDVYKLYTSIDLDIMHLHLLAGEQIPLHVNPLNTVFCVVEGHAQMEINGKTHGLDTFDVIEVPSGAERSLKNNANSDLRILVLKKQK